MGFQRELAEELERVVYLSEAREFELPDEDVLSLASSDRQRVPCWQPERGDADEGEENVQPEPSQPPCPPYVELLSAMERYDDRFLYSHNTPAPVSRPFLPGLHNEIKKGCKNSCSACIDRHQRTSYTDDNGMREHGYVLQSCLCFKPLKMTLQLMQLLAGHMRWRVWLLTMAVL